MNILVVYASAHGSTRDIAERIAARLSERGLNARASPVEGISTVEGIGAVVLGSAVHNGDWLPPAVEFVRQHRTTLAAHPVWLFSVGARDALQGRVGGRVAARYPDPKSTATLNEALHPRGHRVFTGVVQRAHYPALARWLFRLMGGRFGDFRDWRAIEQWADEIARELGAKVR